MKYKVTWLRKENPKKSFTKSFQTAMECVLFIETLELTDLKWYKVEDLT